MSEAQACTSSSKKNFWLRFVDSDRSARLAPLKDSCEPEAHQIVAMGRLEVLSLLLWRWLDAEAKTGQPGGADVGLATHRRKCLHPHRLSLH